ncbi:MAG: 3-deoxy-manno-octulosonate cytidylyltransferase [Acidobacteria bacterium]|nr:3-deoxy-manno-octulosonate cytidylyltransferase [Acidobacteriota bacterium]MBI3422184.1 3-deoxy-manno-octulosonate cytidylyltransferase [Acidobacteriota bacterium]
MVIALIPARYASTRLPGKPLLDIGGVPMILRVVQRARQAASIQRVIVATDDERVFATVKAAREEVWLTSPAHRTGTDRLAEVAAQLDAGIIVNVQGDEPLIEPATIDAAVAPLLADASIVMSTTCEPIESAADLLNPNVVKVVTDTAGFALYFSRNPIPYPRAEAQAHGSLTAALQAQPELLARYAKHTGLYAYRRDFLLQYAKLPPTPLEQTELLEQLRALEHGYRIRVVKVRQRSIGVDTPEDLELVRRLCQQ